MRGITVTLAVWGLVGVSCGNINETGDDDDDDDDAVTADADPNAPDSDPNAPDAARPGTPDASRPGTPDARTGDGGSVTCGDMTCMHPDVCCVRNSGPGSSSECTDEASCDGSVVACDGPEDCAGGVCCAEFSPLGGGGAKCTDGFCSTEICHTADDCTDATDMCCEFFGAGVCSAFCSSP